MIHSQTFKDWGIVLSPSFVLCRESFLVASVISISTVEVGEGGYLDSPVIILRDEVLKLAGSHAEAGLEILLDKGYIEEWAEGKYLIGCTKGFNVIEYLFEKKDNFVMAGKPKIAYDKGQLKQIPKPTKFKAPPIAKVAEDGEFEEVHESYLKRLSEGEIEKQLKNYLDKYTIFCQSIKKPTLSRSVNTKVSQIIREVENTDSMTSLQLNQYLLCFNTIINEYSACHLSSFMGKEMGIAKRLLTLLDNKMLLTLIPFYVSNFHKIKPNLPANIMNLSYHKDVIIKRYHDESKRSKPTTESDDLA